MFTHTPTDHTLQLAGQSNGHKKRAGPKVMLNLSKPKRRQSWHLHQPIQGQAPKAFASEAVRCLNRHIRMRTIYEADTPPHALLRHAHRDR
jgi:hypothetical protein